MKTIFIFKRLAWFILMVNLFASNLVSAETHPNMYLNQEEIDAINSKVNANIEPWKSAYSQTISAANSALNQSPLSVTFGDGRTDHQYYTQKPYCGWPSPPAPSNGCIDGQINPNADREDYESAIILGASVRDLGLAYAFTGNTDYADKAIELIWYWSLNPDTYMKPNTAVGNRIELFITLPGLFYGADLIWNYAGWDSGEKAAFAIWVETLGYHARTRGVGVNNFANWRLVLIASVGALLDDQALLDFVESEWQRLLPIQMNNSGSAWAGRMGQESSRKRGLHYSLYAVNAMIQAAEIMRHHNVNLYDASNEGSWLELALDFIAPYAINPASWTTDGYEQTTPISQNDSMALFELAYSYYQKPLYLDVINRWGRPLDEIRVMGITTLTHGNYFELNFSPTAPTISTQPFSQSIEEGLTVTFNVSVNGSGPLQYQWFRNDDPIAGTDSASYTIDPVTTADNGSKYHSKVTNGLGLGDAISNYATLTVIADTTAPVIAGAVVQSPIQVDVVFSEAVTSESVQTVTNYQIEEGIQVLSASLNADNKTVHLQTDALVADTVYTLTVNNIQDTSEAANSIAANSSIEIQFAPVMNFDNGNFPFGWIPLTELRWSVVADNGNNALFLNTTEYNPLIGNRLGEHIISPDSYSDFTLTVEAKTNESASNGNADYALVFGFEDGKNYYYMLFNRTMSNAQLFLVDEGVRQELATVTQSLLIDEEYHDVEVRRIGDTIEVKFDNTVVLQTVDSTFLTGKIGLGSYNDSAYFDNIRITGAMTMSDVIFASDFE